MMYCKPYEYEYLTNQYKEYVKECSYDDKKPTSFDVWCVYWSLMEAQETIFGVRINEEKKGMED